MAYVSVPKDLTKVKNKVAFNLTRRQIICFGIAGAAGIPFYFLTRNLIGDSSAMMGMVLIMVPAFLFAMYEKDGMPLEKVLMNMATVKYRRPAIRRYETVNLYELPDTAEKRPGKAAKGGGRRQEHAFEAGNYGRNIDSRRSPGLTENPAYSGRMTGPARSMDGTGMHPAPQKGGWDRARQG